VNVRGFLTKPSLVKKDEIEFGLVQLGESNTTYIEVFNPSDEPMSIQILLAPEEFADIHNNSMFFSNKQRLFPLNNITILECNYFNISNFIDQTSQNFTQNFISNLSKKRLPKKKGEEIIDLNSNSILVEEEISNDNLNNRKISKSDLLKKIFLYTNVNSKLNFLESERIICNSNFFKKNEIIFNNNKELIEKIFSEEFMKEINIIKRMTDKVPPVSNRVINRENNMNIFESIVQTLKIFFKTETQSRKKRQDEFNINSNNLKQIKQEFYLPKSLSNQVFIIKPHQKTKIGPIIFSPSNYSENSTATLFIKNNLTVLYPIKLKGHGGSGVLNFFLIDKRNETQIKEKKFDELILNIDSLEEIENGNGEIRKEIKVQNTGNLPAKINNITVKDSGCEGYGIKLSRCDGFLLNPDESMNLEISIKPDFNFYYLEKEILFETTHQTISIKILISISNEILSQKNRLFNFENLKNYGLFSFSGSLLMISIIIYILKKEKVFIINQFDLEQKSEKIINLVNSKEIIEKNNLLKFENLFIKAYRKNNREFYEEFFSKHMDAPTKHEVENLISDKKKKNFVNKNIYENSKLRNDELYKNKNCEGNNDNFKNSVSKDSIVNESEGKAANQENSNKNITKEKETANKTQPKKSNSNANNKVSSTNSKKTTSKRPYGIGSKGQDTQNSTQVNTTNVNKKEDEKKTLHNILNSGNQNYNSISGPQNFFPGNIYQTSSNSKFELQTPSLNKINFNATAVNNNNYNNPIQNNLLAKDEMGNIPPEFYANQMNPNWGDPTFYQAAAIGFWPKNYSGPSNYPNYPSVSNNVKRYPNQAGFDPNQKINFTNSFNTFPSADEKRNGISLNPNNPSFISQQLLTQVESNPNFSKPQNTEVSSFTQSGKFTNNIDNLKNNASINTDNLTSKLRNESKEEKNEEYNQTTNKKDTENDTKINNNTGFNFNSFNNIDFSGGNEISQQSGISNIKDQFMSFVPGLFTPEAYYNNNNNNNNTKNNGASNFLNMNFITHGNETTNNKGGAQQDNADLDLNQNKRPNLNNNNLLNQNPSNVNINTNDNLMGNFNMIDFTNYFTNKQNDESTATKVNQETNPFGFKEGENNENSDNEEPNLNKFNNMEENESINENEYDFNKYRSDREKLIEDSGTEDRELDIKFNFNSIFGQNNMKLINPSYNDFNTDNEEPKQNFDGNKPYFDKNLFFSFDSVFNGGNNSSSFFNNGSTNLFSGNTKSSNLLSELRDDDHEDNNVGNNKKNNNWEPTHNRLDDVAEIEDDEDEEEDPVWNTENVDISKEGFFDASGNYKLKQMDFNFNLDFNSRK